MEIKLKGVNIAKVFEEKLHDELPYLPIVVIEGEEFDVYVTAIIAGLSYKVTLHSLVHDGVDRSANAIASAYKYDALRYHVRKEGEGIEC